MEKKNDPLDFNKSNRTLSYVNPDIFFLVLELALGHQYGPIVSMKHHHYLGVSCVIRNCVCPFPQHCAAPGALNLALTHQEVPLSLQYPGGSFCSVSPDSCISRLWCHRVGAVWEGCATGRYAESTQPVLCRGQLWLPWR